MATLIIPKNSYDTFDALKNVFQYISNGIKSIGLVGAQNMLVNHSLEQAMAVNRYFYNKTEKKVIHFILSFAAHEYITPADAFREGYNICNLLPEYQIKFAVHQDTNNLHIHFAINPISLIDGHKFYFDYGNLYDFVKGLRKIFEPYEIKIEYRFSDNSNNFMLSEHLNYTV